MFRNEAEGGFPAAESERLRRFYEAILSSTPDFVYVFSLDHRVLYANEALIEMWGRGREGAIGKTFLEIGYEPWHAEMHCREIDQVASTGEPIRGEVPYDGTLGRRIYDYIFVPIFGVDGAVEAVAGTTRDVTERKVAEENLRASEERQRYLVLLSDALRRLSDPIAVEGAASRILGGHLGADRVVYFTIEGNDYLIEQCFAPTVAPLVGRFPVADFGATLHRAFLEGRTVVESDIHQAAEYSESERAAFAAIQVRSQVAVPLVKGGRFIAGLAVHSAEPRVWSDREIAIVEETAERTWAAVERARVAEALRQSEERSAFVRRSSGVGFWYCDLPFDVLHWDELVKAHFHLAADALVTIGTFYERIHPDDREPTRRAIEQSIAGRTPYNTCYRTVHAETGEIRWIRAIGRTFYGADGNPERFDGVTLDVSDQKRAEADLIESEERRRLALDAAELGAWHLDSETHTLTTDERCRLLVAGSTEALGYAEAFAMIHADDREPVRAALAAAMRIEDPVPYAEEFRVIHADGSVHWIYAKGRAHRDGGGDDGRRTFDGIVVDITARKQTEEERERLVGELQCADRRKDVFLATLAHELRNPLAPISNGLSLMELSGLGESLEPTRAMMERQVNHLVRLVDDLLDLSRITKGKLQLQRDRIALAEVIEAAVETSLPAIEQGDHALEISLPPEPVLVDGDAIRLAQVVGNLLSNSAKYTERGGRIQITLAREGAMACLTVKDNGIGIPPAMLDRIFEMFSQVDRSLEKVTGGLGIGLALVKGLVEMHGGTIEAHSAGDGSGSEFVLRLPIPVTPESMGVETPAEGEGAERPRRRILVADDNVDSADSLGKLLEILGNEVDVAYDGEEAVERVRANHYEMIFLDIAMPRRNGFEAAREIRELPGGEMATLIAMTGWGQAEDREQTRRAGFHVHLVKPVNPQALRDLLR